MCYDALGTTPRECDTIASKVKLLYDVRSTIVHQGCEEEKERIIKDAVQEMYSLSMSILLELSRKTVGADKWRDIGSLIEEMDRKTFSR